MQRKQLPRKRPIRIGVSSCLIGQGVRYDGTHKRDRYVTEVLGELFELVPVCPEIAIGLGVPRPPIQLVGNADAPRAVGVDDPTHDVTDQLVAYARRMARELDDICGYVFKSRSPSCGVDQVPVHGTSNDEHGSGSGVYARAFMAAQPGLPVETEDHLRDPRRCARFIEQVRAFRRRRKARLRTLT